MKNKYLLWTKNLFEILLVAGLFVLAAYLVQTNLEFFEKIIGERLILGMVIFVLVEIVSIVIAPVTTIPLLPVASNVWGWFIAGILSSASWVAGSILAFVIARKYGIKLVKKFISGKNLKTVEDYVPRENVFWGIVALRMTIPVDVLSYALGLFSKISLQKYALATLIGITPMAFVLAYVGELKIEYQLIGLLIISIVVLITLIVLKIKKIKN